MWVGRSATHAPYTKACGPHTFVSLRDVTWPDGEANAGRATAASCGLADGNDDNDDTDDNE